MARALLDEAVEVKIYETTEESDAHRFAVILDIRRIPSTVTSAPRGVFDLSPGHFRVFIAPEHLDDGEAILQEFLQKKAFAG
ncbi:MAG: hypothetical protein ACREJQ_05060 [bacterium]